MQYRRLGRSGLQVSEFSFGTWLTFGKQIGDGTAKECMYAARDAGINFFDNAEVYARCESERVMGEILKDSGWTRDSYIVSSKAFFGTHGPDASPTFKGLHRKHLVEACHQALQRLRVEYLDLYYCHRPDKNTPIEEVVFTMHNLIQQGKILYWGTSEWSAQEIQAAIGIAQSHHLIGPVMEQPQYNLFVRQKMECDFLNLFRDYGLGTTIWSPLLSGVLTGKYNAGISADAATRLTMEGMSWLKDRVHTDETLQKVRMLTTLADELGISTAALSLAWCLRNPNVSTVILGASQPKQVLENVKAAECTALLTEEVMNRIEDIVQTKPELPEF
jgi:voltage-dependent potassium channel beta subunit